MAGDEKLEDSSATEEVKKHEIREEAVKELGKVRDSEFFDLNILDQEVNLESFVDNERNDAR